MALIISIIVHLVIFLFVGSVVIFEGKIPPNLFASLSGDFVDDAGGDELEAPPLLEDVPQPEPMEDPLEIETPQDMDLSDVMNTSDVIVANTVSPALNTPMMRPTITRVNIGSAAGSKIAQPASSTNRGKSGPGVPRTANIFGRQISASKFGAILDVSFSTHNTLPVAITEITEGFPDAIIMLAPGCGMKSGKEAEIINGDEFTEAIEEVGSKDALPYTGPKGAKGYFMGVFLDRLMKGNKEHNELFRELWKDARRDGRAYVTHVVISEKQQESGNVGGQIHNTQDSFEFLLDLGCDVIYWLADFNDSLEGPLFEDIVKDMKRNEVKVVIHDFDGQTGKDTKQRAQLAEMVKDTSGEMIVGDPNEAKKKK